MNRTARPGSDSRAGFAPEGHCRRQFLSNLGLGLGLGFGLLGTGQRSHAIEPFARPGKSRLLLSLAAYSFRDHFVDTPTVPEGVDSERRMDMFRFLDYCAREGCHGAELTSYYFAKDADDAYFTALRREAFLRGIAVSGTAVGNTFTHSDDEKQRQQIDSVKTWIRRAALMGAPHVRVFAGNADVGQSLSAAKKRCIEALEECAAFAGQYGIFLGLENHGGIVAEAKDLLDIVKTVQSPWVGINLDTGNFHTDDPHRDLALCAPYAVNVQFKGMIRARRQPQQPDDYARTFSILRDANYQGYVALEYELSEDPWMKVPQMLDRMREFMG